MTIKIGDRLPQATFHVMTADGPQTRETGDIFKGKKVVLVAVPGAFTPTCTLNHLPGYINDANAIKAKGVDSIAVTAVNDVFVMNAWAKASGGEGKVEFLSDGNADFAKAIGLSFDGSGAGLGVRSKRYAMLVEDGIVKVLNVEDVPSKAETSASEAMLKAL